MYEKNSNYARITSDLNSKVKEFEHERDSLVTAMKLHQQEFEQEHYKRDNDQATLKFESNNRYSVLNDDTNTHTVIVIFMLRSLKLIPTYNNLHLWKHHVSL